LINKKIEELRTKNSDILDEVAESVKDSQDHLELTQSFLTNPLSLSLSNQLLLGGLFCIICIGGTYIVLKVTETPSFTDDLTIMPLEFPRPIK
jgi:hypothetical protein